MTVDEAIAKIGEHIEKALEEDEDILSWDTENEIKDDIINSCELDDIFNDKEALEDIYIYEMFDESQYAIPKEKKIEMIQAWVSSLSDLASIEVDLDVSSIN